MDWQAITAAFDRLDAALDVVAGLNFDALSTAQWLALLGRCETVRRRLPVPEHQLINHLARQASPEELGGKLSHAIAEWMLISRAEATRRINLSRAPRYRGGRVLAAHNANLDWPTIRLAWSAAAAIPAGHGPGRVRGNADRY
ncbi:DUF222 domain-containing protein [Mycobacterium ostraviense]|uniref:DUF222 domain-containing protein n=1 Tax=Mycobacterium ostraviense TaxID=2738409 RepID=UPI0009E1B70E|nr:DUF222 domain-containing protein [Mycobacterium ostraviense]